MKLDEKTGLYENYGPWHVPFWQTQKFQLAVKIGAVFIVLSFIVFLIIKYLQYRKRKKLPLWDQALAQLRQLKQDEKVSALHGKEFYLTVSALLKNYLSQRFGYNLIGKTDDEATAYLQDHHQDTQLVENMKSVLQGGVIIKFANAQAVQDQIERDYVQAITIIERTIEKKG